MKTPSHNPCLSLNVLLWTALILLSALTARAQTINNVLAFDGDGDYVTVSNSPALQPPDALTVEAWIQPRKQPNVVNTFWISKGDGADCCSSRSYDWQWYRDGYFLLAVFFASTNEINFTVPAAESNWVHVAVVFSSADGFAQVFTNGLSAWKITTTKSGVPLKGLKVRQSTQQLTFGLEPYYMRTKAKGYMDEVRIWNTARTPNEIYGNRFCRLTGTESNLVGYWTFDDGTLTDQTGHGHNGTGVGNAHAEPVTGTDFVHDGVCGAELPARAARASATLTNGFVIDAVLTDGGHGYTNTPTVRIFEGGGSGAQAEAVVSDGMVVAVRVLSAGSDYSSQPVIVISPPFIEQPMMSIVGMSLLSFTNLAAGTNYQLQAFKVGAWSNLGAAFTASNSTFTQFVSGTAGARDYRLAVLPVPTQAYATAQVVNGFLVGATVTSGGSGYSSSPAVTISGGGGSNATAIAFVGGGVVTNIHITSAGSGYTNRPAISIAPPPVPALWPVVTQVMRLDLQHLAPYDNYQFDFNAILGEAWGAIGSPFTSTSTNSTQYLNVSGASGFFRARHVP